MRCYLSFSDKEVFEGVTPLEEMSTDPAEEAEPHSMTTMPAIAPKEQATRKASQEQAMERKSPKFPTWEKVLHPSWPVVAVGQLPFPSRNLEQTYLLMADHNWHTKMAPTEAPSPTQELEVVQQGTPAPGFLEVTACLRGGKKYCTHPGLWWLWGSFLFLQEIWSRLICLWQIIIGIQRWPPQKPPPLHKN